MSLLPIIFLVLVTIKPNPLPTTISLPLAAMIMFLIRLMYLQADPQLTCASVILGMHEVITPLSIMAGAITLFETMEATNCMPFMMREMKALTGGHPVTELMLIFCFAYMVEGASGFGTPVALGAPMLVSLGHDAFKSVVTLLLMNTFATVWGAVGTPIWFGLGALELSQDEFQEISKKAGIALAISAYMLLPFIFSIMLPMEIIKANWKYFLLGLTSCIGPSLGLSFVTYEFPALIGGLVGCVLNAVIIYYKIGVAPYEPPGDVEHLKDPLELGSVSENAAEPQERFVSMPVITIPQEEEEEHDVEEAQHQTVPKDDAVEEENEVIETNGEEKMDAKMNMQASELIASQMEFVQSQLGPRKAVGEGYVKEVAFRTFPLWGTVLLLIVTRVEQIGLKSILQDTEPNLKIYLGTWGTFRISASLVLELRNVLDYPNLRWKYELLYVPFLIPFVLISLVTMWIYRKEMRGSPGSIARLVASRLYNPALALCGALVLVQLMITGDQTAPATIIGSILSDAFKEGFIAIAGLLGVLGSFFSGSTTVSNLTFGDIQRIAAESIGTSVTTMLALQVTGASAGNGVCLNNIISACAVVGLSVPEGQIVMQTYRYVFSIVVIATIVMLAFFFRFE
jgi:L-lactate permease